MISEKLVFLIIWIYIYYKQYTHIIHNAHTHNIYIILLYNTMLERPYRVETRSFPLYITNKVISRAERYLGLAINC